MESPEVVLRLDPKTRQVKVTGPEDPTILLKMLAAAVSIVAGEVTGRPPADASPPDSKILLLNEPGGIHTA